MNSALLVVGTSLPELATAIMAAIRKESDICYGNVIGSNIMNVLSIIDLTAVILPLDIKPGVLAIHFPFMLLFTITLVPLLWTGYRISRLEGGALLFGYATYIYVSFQTGQIPA